MPQPVEDAAVTRHLFLKLAGMAAELDVFTLAEVERLVARLQRDAFPVPRAVSA